MISVWNVQNSLYWSNSILYILNKIVYIFVFYKKQLQWKPMRIRYREVSGIRKVSDNSCIQPFLQNGVLYTEEKRSSHEIKPYRQIFEVVDF